MMWTLARQGARDTEFGSPGTHDESGAPLSFTARDAGPRQPEAAASV